MSERSSSTSVESAAALEDADGPPIVYADGPLSTASSHARRPFVSAGHDVLFANDDAKLCDICGVDVTEDDEGPRIAGSALYVSTRGDVVRYDEPPLCPSCATAIGVTALQRWDLEEEEG